MKITEGKKVFLITIDTEADNQWDFNMGCTTKNVQFLPRFQELAEKYCFKPTWLTTFEMAENNDFVNYFKTKQDKGLCEIGMHLHAWNNPPQYSLNIVNNERPYLIEYPEKIMEEKIKFLDSLLTDKFGIKPISHRAGRWAMNEKYFNLLEKYGYKIDCSVTPYVNWKNCLGATGLSGTDYSKKSCMPYMHGNILELPVTIKKIHIFQKERVVNLKRLVSEIQKYITGRYQWMRPDKYCIISGMIDLVNKCKKNNEYIMFMIHSSELMPSGSPNFKTEDSIDHLYDLIQRVFEYISKNGYVGMTLREYYNWRNNNGKNRNNNLS